MLFNLLYSSAPRSSPNTFLPFPSVPRQPTPPGWQCPARSASPHLRWHAGGGDNGTAKTRIGRSEASRFVNEVGGMLDVSDIERVVCGVRWGGTSLLGTMIRGAVRLQFREKITSWLHFLLFNGLHTIVVASCAFFFQSSHYSYFEHSSKFLLLGGVLYVLVCIPKHEGGGGGQVLDWWI